MPSVADALREAARRHPTGVACITHRGQGRAPLTTTYAELQQTASGIAGVLSALANGKTGSGGPARVAMLCRNHELALAYLFAAAAAGCIAAPLNTRWAAPEAAAALADCDPAVLVCDASLWPLCHAALAQCPADKAPSLRAVLLLYADDEDKDASSDDDSVPFQHPSRASSSSSSVSCMTHEAALSRLSGPGSIEASMAEAEEGGQEDASVQCLVYTSGSTGEPKGVMLRHGAQLLQAREKVRLGGYGPSTRYLSLAPLFHVAGLNSSIAVTLAGGAHVFLQGAGKPRGLAPPEAATEALAAHAVDTLVVVPAMLAALLDALERDEEEGVAAAEGVRFILVGGQPLTEPLWHRTAAAFSGARVVQSYACSEACSSIAFLPMPPLEAQGPFPPPGLVGSAAGPVEIAILALEEEEEQAEEQPPSPPHGRGHCRRRRMVTAPGQSGEIATRGPHLMAGYWRKPLATARVLVEVEGEGDNKGRSGGGGPWLCTGDVGSLDASGRLWFEGRLADVIRSGGEKVMAAEVERALLAHPAVAHAAVLGEPDPALGERVVALVVLRGGVQQSSGRGMMALDGEALRRHCRGRLAGFKVPKEVRLVPSLPLSASGKVLKGRLKKQNGNQQHQKPQTLLLRSSL